MNTNFFRIGLIIFSLLIFHKSFSQENFLSGYIIKDDIDTIYGYIDYRDWGKNPINIKFKRSLSSESATYSPLDIKGFEVNDKIYKSGIIETEISTLNPDKMEKDPQLKIKVDTAFVQALFVGKKSLYFYKNRDKKENL